MKIGYFNSIIRYCPTEGKEKEFIEIMNSEFLIIGNMASSRNFALGDEISEFLSEHGPFGDYILQDVIKNKDKEIYFSFSGSIVYETHRTWDDILEAEIYVEDDKYELLSDKETQDFLHFLNSEG